MTKLWSKVNGTWVKLGADTKDDVGLSNVQNFTYTNSATDGSSSKYATGAAVKQAYDEASKALSSSDKGIRLGGLFEGTTITRYDMWRFMSIFDRRTSNLSNSVLCGVRNSGTRTHYGKWRRIIR